MALVWNQLNTIQAPPDLTTDFFYLRLIGDRSIQEKDFGSIQKDRQSEMSMWAEALLRARNNVKFGIVAANNHYAGFGPATVNLFRKTLGLPELAFTDKNQASLSEF